MKRLTHFEIENERQLEQVYHDYEDDFTMHLEDAIRAFRRGVRIIQANQFNQIKFENEVDPRSEEINNPYAEPKSKEKTETHVDEVKSQEPDKSDKVLNVDKAKMTKKGLRRHRIDIILFSIGLEIEPKVLDKLIQVIDLDNEYADKANVGQILKLLNE